MIQLLFLLIILSCFSIEFKRLQKVGQQDPSVWRYSSICLLLFLAASSAALSGSQRISTEQLNISNCDVPHAQKSQANYKKHVLTPRTSAKSYFIYNPKQTKTNKIIYFPIYRNRKVLDCV